MGEARWTAATEAVIAVCGSYLEYTAGSMKDLVRRDVPQDNESVTVEESDVQGKLYSAKINACC